MKELKDNMLTQIRSQKKEFDETLAVMDQIRGAGDRATMDLVGRYASDVASDLLRIAPPRSAWIVSWPGSMP